MATSQQTAPVLQALHDGTLAGNWTLDPARSQVRLRSKSMWGMVSVKGAFGQVAGAAVITRDGEVSGTLTVGAASLDTRNKKRDDHLRSADFFDAARYPDITFTLDRVQPSGQGVTVTGSLTVRGQTRPLSFGAAVSSSGGDELRLEAEVQVNRGDFGLSWNQLGMASTDNTITIQAAFTRK
jgi:polyisoprenoid-binding protein YceI